MSVDRYVEDLTENAARIILGKMFNEAYTYKLIIEPEKTIVIGSEKGSNEVVFEHLLDIESPPEEEDSLYITSSQPAGIQHHYVCVYSIVLVILWVLVLLGVFGILFLQYLTL